MEGEVVAKLTDFNSQDLANTLWSVSIFCYELSFFDDFHSRLAEFHCYDFSPAGLSQLYQAHMVAETFQWPFVLPTGLLEAAKQHQMRASEIVRTSHFQRQVHTELVKMDYSAELEYRTPDGMFSLDIRVVHGEDDLAVEADGPSHFAINKQVQLGHTKLRNVMLEARGYTVVSIPYYEWDSLASTIERQSYLCAKLTGAQGKATR
eukprot:gene21933-26413_t